jgi:hypothetical protein
MVGALALLSALLLASAALAVNPFISLSLYVSPTGIDQGNCQSQQSPCRTLQYAADNIPSGYFGFIYPAHGVYPNASVSIYEFRRAVVTGDCTDPTAVVFDNGTPGAAIIYVEDHATAGVLCLTLRASDQAVNLIVSRQHTITDFGKIHFAATPGGTINVIAAPSDHAIMSCAGDVWLDAPANVYAFPGGNSEMNLGCPHHMATQAVTYFVDGGDSLINAATTTVDGAGAGSGNVGMPYILSNSMLHLGNATLPGNVPGQLYHGAQVD